jgi:hypothetical protein
VREESVEDDVEVDGVLTEDVDARKRALLRAGYREVARQGGTITLSRPCATEDCEWPVQAQVQGGGFGRVGRPRLYCEICRPSHASLAGMVHVTCAWCGTQVDYVRRTGRPRKYCSDACKREDWHWRHPSAAARIYWRPLILLAKRWCDPQADAVLAELWERRIG